MLKVLKKALLCTLVACMLLGCISCNFPGKQEETETDADSQSETEVETEADTDPAPRVNKVEIKLDGNIANVLYSIDRDDTLTDATKTFASDYSNIVGKKISPKKAGTDGAEKPAILIGNIDYPESQEVYASLKYSEVKACVVGNKLVVAGYNTALMAEVLSELDDMIKEKKDANGNIVLEEDFKIEKTFAEPLSAIPVFAGAEPAFSYTGDDCYMVDFGGVNKTKFNKYCDSMTSNGLELYAEKTLGTNVYKTYANDEYVVTTIYTAYNNNGKVLVEPLSSTELPAKAENNVYTPVEGLETTVTQVGLADGTARNYNGMCYVIRLSDGSFIIIDGGFNNTGYADRIYEIMKKQAVDPENIVVAAWIISHAHSDHVAVLSTFFNTYKDKITVERFICNLPDEGQLVNNWENERDGNISYTNRMREFLYTTLKDIPKVKAHPGQEFNIRNVKIDVYYTIDVYNYDNNRKLDDYNNTSVVFKLEAEGTKIMFLGDYDDKAYTMKKLYTMPLLDADAVQMAHHGLPENSSGALYELITPTYVFWPAGAWVVKTDVDLYNGEQNKWIIEHCNEENIYLAEDNVYVFDMKDRTCDKYDTVEDYLASAD